MTAGYLFSLCCKYTGENDFTIDPISSNFDFMDSHWRSIQLLVFR